MKKKSLVVLLLSFLLVFTTACSNDSVSENSTEQSLQDKDYEQIVKESKGKKITFYGYGGSDLTNNWVDNYLADTLKKKYDITLERVGMDIDEILNVLMSGKQADEKEGNIDIIWINGENFFTAKENDLLYGPFLEKLPNAKKYLDMDSDEVKYDFGYKVDGYEAPFGKAQVVMIYNSDNLTPVANAKELMELAKANPGRITYPSLPDFTGSAFVRNIIYDVVGYEQFMDMKADKKTVKKAIQPAIDYLKELKPYLWKKGVTYPADASQQDNMFANNEVDFMISYNPSYASNMIEKGTFEDNTKTFVFDKGTLSNTNFLAIAKTSANKEAAMVAINEVLSFEAQLDKMDPTTWGDMPVFKYDKLSDDEKDKVKQVDTGVATLPQEELSAKSLPEIPADLVPIIEEIWMEEIPGE